MFRYSIDLKNKIQDPNGNMIVDLAASMFNRHTEPIKDYEIVRMTKKYVMRPDLVSYNMYETD